MATELTTSFVNLIATDVVALDLLNASVIVPANRQLGADQRAA
jgi:hypothetical protein